MAYTSDENTSGTGSMEETSKKIRSAHMQAPEETPQVSQNEGDPPKDAEGAAGDAAPAPKAKSEGELNQDPHALLDDQDDQKIKKEIEDESEDKVKREMSADPNITKLMLGPKKDLTMREVTAKIRAAQGRPDEELPISPAETKKEQQQVIPKADEFSSAPKEWIDKREIEVRKSNPDYTQEQVSKAVGDIWRKDNSK